MNIILNISDEEYKWIKEHESGVTSYPITVSIYDKIREATILNDTKFVAVDDIVKRYLFHAEDRASHEISQIIHEVKKYNYDEIKESK